MDFLKFNPAVYVIGEEYEICVALEEFGLVTVKVGDEIYYEDNSGVLPTEKLYARIRIPQEALNKAKSYTVIYRKTIERKSYWSTLGEEQTVFYNFKAPKKGKNLNIYHVPTFTTALNRQKRLHPISERTWTFTFLTVTLVKFSRTRITLPFAVL
jgi:hypothetical protein